MRGGTVEMAILLDTYGALLTPKQREYCDWYYNEDLSLAEIAENAGITPPGAHDIIRRATDKLRETERRLGTAGRTAEARARLTRAVALTQALQAAPGADEAARARLAEVLTLINEVANGL